MVTKISTNKKSEPKQKEKNPDSHVPFKRQDKLQNIKRFNKKYLIFYRDSYFSLIAHQVQEKGARP